MAEREWAPVLMAAMRKPTIRVAVTEEEVDLILAGYANTAGMHEPDPRSGHPEHMEYLKGGEELDEHVEELLEAWDELYAFKEKWERRKRLLAAKRGQNDLGAPSPSSWTRNGEKGL